MSALYTARKTLNYTHGFPLNENIAYEKTQVTLKDVQSTMIVEENTAYNVLSPSGAPATDATPESDGVYEVVD